MENRPINLAANNFLSKITSFKYIYTSLLLLSFLLTFIPDQILNSARIFYFSSALFVFCFIWWEKFLRPIYLYLLMQVPYVAAISLGFWFDIPSLYYLEGIPSYPLPYYVKAFQIGLVALLAISLVLPNKNDIITPNPAWDMEEDNNARFLYYFLIIALIIVSIAQWGYAYMHKEAVFEQYAIIIGEENKEYFMISRMDMVFYNLALIFLIYNPKWYEYKLFWVVILSFFAFKFRTGGRMALTYLGLLIFWRAYLDNKIPWFSWRIVKVTAILAGFFILGLVGAWRQSGFSEPSLVNMIFPFYFMSLEFLNGTFSVLSSVFYVHQGLGPTPVMPFFDPIIALLPSFLLEGREELLYFRNWLESVGGIKSLAPAAGIYLPSQPYLFTGSLVAVFIMCLALAKLIQWLYTKMLSSPRKVDMFRGLVVISYVMVISLRTEYWIVVKLSMFSLILFPVLSILLAQVILSVGRGRFRLELGSGTNL
jgi:hypothetical protein